MKTLAKIAWLNIKLAWYWLDNFVACIGSLERGESLSNRWTQVEWERGRSERVNAQLSGLTGNL